MRYALPFGGRNLCGANVKATINLHGVEIDNFCSDAARDVKGKVALTGACGPQYNRERDQTIFGHAPDDGSVLLDKSAPGFAAPIAKHHAEAVGDSRDGATVGVAKRIAHGFFGHFFRGAAPDVSEFVAQAQMIAMAEAIKTSIGTLFFEIEEAARHFAVDTTALEDTTVDH